VYLSFAFTRLRNPRLSLVALDFIVSQFGFPIVSQFGFPIVHDQLGPLAELESGRRSAICEAVRCCFERNLSAGCREDRRKIGGQLFKCITNVDFLYEHFETPLRAGLHLFFIEVFFADPEPLVEMGEWVKGLWVFERSCFVHGSSEFIEGRLADIRGLDLARLVVEDEEAPVAIRWIQERLGENAVLYDRVRGDICAILTRLITGSDEFLCELNCGHFFAGLLVGMEDRGPAFKFDAMFLLAVAFQRLPVSEQGDFVNARFVELLESIEDSVRLPDGQDLSGELACVAYRLNDLLDDDSELKVLLYETVPAGLRCTLEDFTALK
jgi:hypothetical protein